MVNPRAITNKHNSKSTVRKSIMKLKCYIKKYSLNAIGSNKEGKKKTWDTEKTKFKTADIIYHYSNNIDCDMLNKPSKDKDCQAGLKNIINCMLSTGGKTLDSKTQIDWKLIDGKRYIMQTATTGKLE